MVDGRRLQVIGDLPGDDDATLVRRIAEDNDERALADLLERHAPKVTGDLRYRFRHQLQPPEIDEAVNRAALKLWKNAHRFDGASRSARGSCGSPIAPRWTFSRARRGGQLASWSLTRPIPIRITSMMSWRTHRGRFGTWSSWNG